MPAKGAREDVVWYACWSRRSAFRGGIRACNLVGVRGLSPNGLLLPWAWVLGPGTAKLFVFSFFSVFFFFSFRVWFEFRSTKLVEKAPAAMSHS